MRILIFAKAFYPSIGGMEVSTRSMAIELVKLGHHVTIFTETDLGSTDELKEGYDIFRSTSLLLLLWGCLRSDRLIIRGGVSAVVGAYAWLLGKPVCIVHELYGPFLHQGNSFKNRIGNFLRSKTVEIADTHLAVSQAVLDSKHLPATANRRVLYNPCEYHDADHQSRMHQKDFDVIFVGRLIEGKGILILMGALKLIDAAGLSIRAVMVGDGPELEKAKCISVDFNHVAVTFVGNISRSKLPDYYIRSKLLVIPTTSHPEGMGIVIAEAFTFSLPVIGTDLPAIREVVGDAGCIVPPNNAIMLKESILKILNDNLVYSDLSDKAWLRSTMFTMDEYRSNLKEIVEHWHRDADS